MWIDFQQSLNQRLTTQTLDSEQNRAKNFSLQGHSLVRGVAGSGKSLVLRNRLEKISEEFQKGDSILVLSYNRFMNAWLQSEIKNADFSKKLNIDCDTFPRWAFRKFKYNFEWDKDENLRQQVIELAKQSSIKYQAVLIDEAQDFYDEWFQAILQVIEPATNSIFFVYDNTQSVYGQPHRRKSSWTWKELGFDIPGGRSQIFELNYRNSPEILEMAWNFIRPYLEKENIKVERRERDGQGRIINTPSIGSIIEPKKKLSRSSNIRPETIQISYSSMPEEIARQVQYALKSYPESSIGILTYPSLPPKHSFKVQEFRQQIGSELSKLGIAHHAPSGSEQRAKNDNAVQRPYVIVDSWNALKGIEFDAVIVAGLDLPDLNKTGFFGDFEKYSAIYTAMTRTRDHLIMLYENESPVVEQVKEAIHFPEYQLDSEQ